MLTKFLKAFFILICLVFLGYLLLPAYNFPAPPPNSPQSNEPADSETPLRRAYFTDYTRDQVLDWYKNQMGWGYLLNYPPEDSQTLIRDQTRTTFLEEIVHPFRESVYVNGFEPATNGQDRIIINGRHFRQKIIIKYVQSNPLVRVTVFAGIVLLTVILFSSWKKTLVDIKNKNIKI